MNKIKCLKLLSLLFSVENHILYEPSLGVERILNEYIECHDNSKISEPCPYQILKIQ